MNDDQTPASGIPKKPKKLDEEVGDVVEEEETSEEEVRGKNGDSKKKKVKKVVKKAKQVASELVDPETKATFSEVKEKGSELAEKQSNIHPKATHAGHKLGQILKDKNKTIGEKIKEVANHVGKGLWEVTKSNALPFALAFLSATCKEWFDDHFMTSFFRARMVLASSQTQIGITANLSINVVVSAVYSRLAIPEYLTDGAYSRGAVSELVYSWSQFFHYANAEGNLQLENTLRKNSAGAFGWMVNTNPNWGHVKANLYRLSNFVLSYLPMYYDNLGQVVRNYDSSINSGAPGMVIKALQTQGGIALSQRYSNADLVTKLFAYTMGEYPLSPSMTMDIYANVHHELQDDAQMRWLFADADYNRMFPLGTDEWNPEIPAVLLDAEQFLQVVSRNANFPVDNLWNPTTFDDEVAVIPISQDMIQNCFFIQLWTLMHLEFPFGIRGAPVNTVQSNRAQTLSNVLDGANDLIANVYRHRIAGGKRIMYVMIDTYQRSGDPYVMRVPNVVAPIPQAVDNAGVNVLTMLTTNNQLANQFAACYRKYCEMYNDPMDIRTGLAAVTEMIGLRSTKIGVRPTDPVNLVGNEKTFFNKWVFSLTNEVQEYNPQPDGGTGLPVGTGTGPSNAIAAAPTIGGAIPATKASIATGVITHEVAGGNGLLRVLTAAHIFVRAEDWVAEKANMNISRTEQSTKDISMKNLRDESSYSKFHAQKINSVAVLVQMVLEQANATMGLIATVHQVKGTPASALYDDGVLPNILYNLRTDTVKLNRHLIQHGTYSLVSLTLPSVTQPASVLTWATDANVFPDVNANFRSLELQPYTQVDPQALLVYFNGDPYHENTQFLVLNDRTLFSDWNQTFNNNEYHNATRFECRTITDSAAEGWKKTDHTWKQRRALIPALTKTSNFSVQGAVNVFDEGNSTYFFLLGDAWGANSTPYPVFFRATNSALVHYNYLALQTNISRSGVRPSIFEPSGEILPPSFRSIPQAGGVAFTPVSLVLTGAQVTYIYHDTLQLHVTIPRTRAGVKVSGYTNTYTIDISEYFGVDDLDVNRGFGDVDEDEPSSYTNF